jgi:multicomponent Na+:H+ antiporter subunit A
VPVDRRISAFYERASYVEGYGRNVVNVILVDFRALDTLGEIAVVAAAALGILAVLRFRRQEAGP